MFTQKDRLNVTQLTSINVVALYRQLINDPTAFVGYAQLETESEDIYDN